MIRKVLNALGILRSRGPFCLVCEILRRVRKKLLTSRHQAELEELLARFADRPVFILHPTFAWKIPMQQRPHRIAKALAEEGALYFFCTTGAPVDYASGFEKILSGLFLTDRYDLLKKLKGPRFIRHFYSTDLNFGWPVIEEALASGARVLYEHVDELSEKLARQPIKAVVKDRHARALKDPRVKIVATARRLYDEAGGRALRNPNGVEFEHFHMAHVPSELPKDWQVAVAGHHGQVIGYFGALAEWFDFELVKSLARACPEAILILVGQDYDGSVARAGFEAFSNIHILKPVAYSELPGLAKIFDVAILPFKINEVTLATSPIKIFEYMALGKPIVTTDLPECRQYKSVKIGTTQSEFITHVQSYLREAGDSALLESEARANTWERRARAILKYISDS